EPLPDSLPGGIEMPSRFPGFAIPRKIDVQYIEANYDKFLTKLESEVTNEEIAKFYDENKDLFVKADTTLIDDTKAEGPAGGGATTEKKDDAAVGATNGDGKSAPASDGKKAPSGAGGAKAAQPTGKSSSNRDAAKSPFRLTAFEQGNNGAKSA